jgi:hypothetical protein
MKYQAIKNFLEEKEFLKIKNTLTSEEFPWMYRKTCTRTDKKDGCCFTHCFYNKGESKSSFNKELNILYKQLKIVGLTQSRANLLLKDKDNMKGYFHCDYPFKENMFTAIFYITSNDGYTLLGKDEQKKEFCEENKIVIFPVNLLHTHVRQTDDSQRIVININYYI